MDQIINHAVLSLDFWQDTVTYEGCTMPAGTIGCEVLNIPDSTIEKLDTPCNVLNQLLQGMNTGSVDMELLPQVQNWKDVPIRKIVEERYGFPTLILHDPNCIMEAERAFGTTMLGSADNAILLRIDNGIGMSVLVDRAIYIGSNGKAGELGHISVDRNGALCVCGKRGCLEEYASGEGLVRRFIEQVNRGRKSAVPAYEVGLNYHMLVDAARQGDPLCLELFRQMGEYLGFSISLLLNLFNPDLVVMYGSLADQHDLYEEAMREEIARYVYKSIPVKIQYSGMGKNAAAQGVALAMSERVIMAFADEVIGGMDEQDVAI